MEKLVIFLTNGLKNTLNNLTYSVSSTSSSENSLISDDVLEIIDNPKDKRKLDEAVDFLINNKNIKEKEVELSNKTITISLG